MPYQLLIFDFDGTLADSFDWFLQSINHAAATHGFAPIPPERVDEYRGLGVRELMRALGIPLWKVPAVTTAMRRDMTANIERIRLFPHSAALLTKLRKHGIRTAIVTSNSQRNVEAILGLKHASMIDHFACGATILGKKRKLREVLSAFDIPRAKVLCIGDEIRDADAAATLGLDFIGVGWGYATAAALSPVSKGSLFETFDDIARAAIGA